MLGDGSVCWDGVGTGTYLIFHLAEALSRGILSSGNDLSLCFRKELVKALVPTAALGRGPQPITDFSRNL